MSRHGYRPPGWPPHCSFVIGWDDVLGSYFGLVTDASVGRDDDAVIAMAGGAPPHFDDLDELMRVVNGRIRGRLPPIQLPGELRRELRKDESPDRPVINSLIVTVPGEHAPAMEGGTPPRPCGALGTTAGYLDASGLREVLAGMADRYHCLERLYLARKGAGLSEDNDADTKLIRWHLERMGAVCHLIDALVRGDALVVREGLQPFHGFSAEAALVLQAQSADTLSPSEPAH